MHLETEWWAMCGSRYCCMLSSMLSGCVASHAVRYSCCTKIWRGEVPDEGRLGTSQLYLAFVLFCVCLCRFLVCLFVFVLVWFGVFFLVWKGQLWWGKKKQRKRTEWASRAVNLWHVCPGELGKLDMLHEGILHKCIQQLLEKKKNTPLRDMEEDMECLCQIIRTVGPRLDTPKAKVCLDAVHVVGS